MSLLPISKLPEDLGWPHLPLHTLIRKHSAACSTISRSTLTTIIILLNARMDLQHCNGSGFRCAYSTYCGQFYVSRPIAQEALVTFAPYDFDDVATDVFPSSFAQRVGPCGNMVCGIISAPSSGLQVAFCSRKPAGEYVLQIVVKGYLGSHASRPLYMLMGGHAHEVDYMCAAVISPARTPLDTHQAYITLDLPSSDTLGPVRMHLPTLEHNTSDRMLEFSTAEVGTQRSCAAGWRIWLPRRCWMEGVTRGIW